METPVRVLHADPKVQANQGQVALARGPLVYCVEQTDCDQSVDNLTVSSGGLEDPQSFETEWESGVLGGYHSISITADLTHGRARGSKPIRLVPYYARANRTERSEWVTLVPIHST